MKKLAGLILVSLLAFVFSGCATTKAAKVKEVHVKCPACGYEFNVPVNTTP